MSKKGLQQLINNNIRNYLDPMKKIVKNAVFLNTNNTIEHEIKKAEMSYHLIKMGHTIITEAPLKTGDRPDILILDTPEPIAYEIMNTETEESIFDKQNRYRIKIVKVKI